MPRAVPDNVHQRLSPSRNGRGTYRWRSTGWPIGPSEPKRGVMRKQEPDPFSCQYDISLRIWHPDMPHEEISKTIGRAPRYAWTVGSPGFSIHGKPWDDVYDFSC